MPVSNELRKKGIFVSSSGVRLIWIRNDLANFKQRLKALEAKVAEDGLILTEPQVQALECKKQDDDVCGEIDTTHPGYLGSQDTFYVGTFKGVGRVYQQTYVDTYSRVAHCKLYTTLPIMAVDLLNDRVLPFLCRWRAAWVEVKLSLYDRQLHNFMCRVALANKTIRTAFAMLSKGTEYQAQAITAWA